MPGTSALGKRTPGNRPDDARYTTATKLRASQLLARLAPVSQLAIPAVTAAADTPTVTWGTTATITSRVIGAQTGQVTEVGSRGTWDSSAGRLAVSGLAGLDFFLTGTTCEIHIRTNTGVTTQPIWIWVNGAPVTATDDETKTGLSGTAGDQYIKLVFPSSARRRIEFFAPSIAAWHSVATVLATLVTPAPRKPVVAFVFDSFGGGTTATPALLSAPFIMSRMLGVEAFSASFGGTGYVTAGAFNTYGSTTRVAQVAAANPELIVLSGSLNDDTASASAVGTAAAAAFAAYAAACPNAKLVVFGPQPSGASGTLSTSRAANNAVLAAAAAAAPNVAAYHDMIGTVAGTLPPVFSGASTYPDGSLVSSVGSVWKLVNNGGTSTGGQASNAPGTSVKWALQTYAYTGTGNIGTPVGDGTRDTYLYSDSIHPTVEGSAALAIRQANAIRADLLAAAA